MTTVTVEDKVIGLAVNPASPVTLTLQDGEDTIELLISNGPDISLEVPAVPEIGLQMGVAQGPSGIYGTTPYTVRVEQVDVDTIYRGEAEPGSSESMTVWRIQKITLGSLTTILWAGGTNSFSFRWADRYTLSYS